MMPTRRCRSDAAAEADDALRAAVLLAVGRRAGADECAGRRKPYRADDGERRLFSGETANVIADLRAFRDFGVGFVDFNFDGATADAMLSNMRRFREDVLAKV